MSPPGVSARADGVERRLPPQPGSVARARREVRGLLESAGREDLVDNAALLVSELVTNALLHAGTTIVLVAHLADGGLRVEVGDGSQHLPVRRRYATTAGTGRGLMMLEQVADAWGVQRHAEGKVVWFEVGRHGSTDEGGVSGHGAAAGTGFEVELLNMPLLLHQAWQEHAEALLREYLLFSLDDEGDDDPIQVHAEATDAIAVLEEHVPPGAVTVKADRLMADATEPRVSAPLLRVPVPLSSVPHFETLDRTIDAALELTERGLVLTPPTQPEIRWFRRWLCDEVRRQAAGDEPRPWHVELLAAEEPRVEVPGWDRASIAAAKTGLIAADESNRILAVSPPAARLLGYAPDGPEGLVGLRLVDIIPERFRQAHVAGFTMYLLVGRRPLVDRRVTVPALHCDGSEVLVDLVVRVHPLGGRQVFVAEIDAAS
ncbi:MAG: ATP-binding protein [Nocardioidaceae bacterium]